MLRVSQEILRRKDGDKSRMQQSTSRATRGVEENKTRLRPELSLQRAERLEVWSKTRQCLRLRQGQIWTTSRVTQSKQYWRRKAETSQERAERLHDNYRYWAI